MEEECADGVAFACLACPSCSYELAGLELVYEFSLVSGWGEAQVFFAENNWVR